MSSKLAFNSYTIRASQNSAEDVEKTFRRLRDIGYQAVELDLDRLLLLIDVGGLKDLLDRIGLRAFSAHVGFERLEQGIEGVIENIKTLGLGYVVVPTLPERFCKDIQGYSAGAKILAIFAEKMSGQGLKFAYHNHAKEFEKFEGKTGLEFILDSSVWKDFLAEIDVYWVQFAGGDPAQWISKYRGRVPLCHVKDLGIVNGKPTTMEVGQGNMNLPDILDECKTAGVEWYIVEQDNSLRDPVESLAMSKTFLNNLGIY
jgi:sugar phosphate isomerase/epimerase